jgi:NitT/TauT family transport system permease protein
VERERERERERYFSLGKALFINKYGCIIAFLALWEILSRTKLINPVFFPPFTAICETIIHMLSTGEMIRHVRISLLRAVPGFLIAAAIGVPLGLLMGTFFKKADKFLEIPLEVFSQINPFLLFHILILFMGIGEAPKITIVIWTCLWPITFSSLNGASDVNKSLIKAGRAFGLGRLGLLRKITIPSASPMIFAGLRLGLGYSMFMLIAAEMMGASSGLGFLTLNSQETFQLNKMYAAVLTIAFLGLILDFMIHLIGKKLLPLGDEGYLNVGEN